MRTTLTLDPDVARMLEEEAHRQRKSFKQVVNDAIRRGLAPQATGRVAPRYRVRPHKTTLRPGIDAGSFNKLVDELEDEAVVARMRTKRVIIPDVNLLLYAEINAHPLHAAARTWWETTLNGEQQVGIAPVCLFGFLRIATNRRVFTDPLTVDDALERVASWLARPNVTTLVSGRDYLELAFRLLRQLGTGGNLTTDVQIAAHALEINGEVCSNDGDFARFEGVRSTNPLRDLPGR